MGNKYQIALIALLLGTIALFSVFLMRELFPEYRTYQEAFEEIEAFRSTLTDIPPAPFKQGVKQIVMQEGKGPEKIDRCISCHVALEVEAYSPTRIAHDVNGEILRDSKGVPLQEKNPNYIFNLMEEAVPTHPELQKLLDPKIRGALQMHPLMAKETRPFEYHSINEYGCTSCHSGNGRALTVDKAHGPVFDGEYDVEDMGPKPVFLERDPHHDPRFATIFNDKPGPELLFQTTPILVGPLMESRCVQCHQVGEDLFEGAEQKMARLLEQNEKSLETLKINLTQGVRAFLTLNDLDESVKQSGYEITYKRVESNSHDETLPAKAFKAAQGQLQILKKYTGDRLLDSLEKEMELAIGAPALLEKLKGELSTSKDPFDTTELFLKKEAGSNEATGTLFKLADEVNLAKETLRHVKDTESGVLTAVNDASNLQGMEGDVSDLTQHFQRGRSLYVSQGCYACHKIAGVARGGVGPELTEEGNSYPWFVKESMVWPQADLKTSTMPNMVLDHEELQDLMTYLLAQKGRNRVSSEIERKRQLKAWDSGERVAIEKPIPAAEIRNLDAGMKTFALQGCASCHRLEGYTSEVGFKADTQRALYEEEKWFRQTIPEDVGSRELTTILKEKEAEINQHIFHGVRPPSILEEIEKIDPKLLPGFFAPFRFSLRADSEPKWQDLVERVMKTYYQVYGLGRLIGPRPNWSGIYRSDEWLMEHFWNPSSHVARSIMPVFPFDDSKFQQLTYMLNELGKRNRDHLRGEWEIFGFDPRQAYDRTCAQCHGDQLKGNGPVATWIYPIPKNLRNGTFLKGLGKKRVHDSIAHGVKGTPMPPWSETWPNKGERFQIPVLGEAEVLRMTNWLFDQLPAGDAEEVPQKWRYTPEDVIRDLNKESVNPPLKGGFLLSLTTDRWTVEDIFDVLPGDPHGVTAQNVYLRKELYTPENIEAGRRLFLINCAMCHGTEADGAGTRAEVMLDAKPRMLTNLDWISSKDDLRLLQSITYGVPGTAMISFADATTTWQRIQLVLYIRSVSEQNLELKKIRDQLYATTIASDQFISNPQIRKLFNEQRKGVEVLGTSISSKEGADDLASLYEKWAGGALPLYSQNGAKPPLDQKALEDEMEAFIIKKIEGLEVQITELKERFSSFQTEAKRLHIEKELKEWRNLLRAMREEFSENRRLWKEQLQ